MAIPLEKVRKVLNIAKESISLETPIDPVIQSNIRETTTLRLALLTPR